MTGPDHSLLADDRRRLEEQFAPQRPDAREDADLVTYTFGQKPARVSIEIDPDVVSQDDRIGIDLVGATITLGEARQLVGLLQRAIAVADWHDQRNIEAGR